MVFSFFFAIKKGQDAINLLLRILIFLLSCCFDKLSTGSKGTKGQGGEKNPSQAVVPTKFSLVISAIRGTSQFH
jgi:hypothetical protein